MMVINNTSTFLYRLIFIVFFGCCSSSTVFAQKKAMLTDEEQVNEAVTKEITELFQSESFLKKKNKKFKSVKGFITVDIAVVQNGKISSFFKVDSDIKDIDFIEFLSETVFAHKFDFKLPKQQRYKIRQTITIE